MGETEEEYNFFVLNDIPSLTHPHNHYFPLPHTPAYIMTSHYSPSLTHPHSGNSRSLHPGSMRLSRPRPPSAREQQAAPPSNTAGSNLPTRPYSVSVRPESAGAQQRAYATYSPSSTSTGHGRFRHPLLAELMNVQHSTDFGDCKHPL